ncbi:unnamed protein product, partial [Coccothraustes coccothraustes]
YSQSRAEARPRRDVRGRGRSRGRGRGRGRPARGRGRAGGMAQPSRRRGRRGEEREAGRGEGGGERRGRRGEEREAGRGEGGGVKDPERTVADSGKGRERKRERERKRVLRLLCFSAAAATAAAATAAAAAAATEAPGPFRPPLPRRQPGPSQDPPGPRSSPRPGRLGQDSATLGVHPQPLGRGRRSHRPPAVLLLAICSGSFCLGETLAYREFWRKSTHFVHGCRAGGRVLFHRKESTEPQSLKAGESQLSGSQGQPDLLVMAAFVTSNPWILEILKRDSCFGHGCLNEKGSSFPFEGKPRAPVFQGLGPPGTTKVTVTLQCLVEPRGHCATAEPRRPMGEPGDNGIQGPLLHWKDSGNRGNNCDTVVPHHNWTPRVPGDTAGSCVTRAP